MKIAEALKGNDVRVSSGWRWMYWDDGEEVFVVREQKYGAKKSIVIVNTIDEDEAVKHLIEG